MGEGGEWMSNTSIFNVGLQCTFTFQYLLISLLLSEFNNELLVYRIVKTAKNYKRIPKHSLSIIINDKEKQQILFDIFAGKMAEKINQQNSGQLIFSWLPNWCSSAVQTNNVCCFSPPPQL